MALDFSGISLPFSATDVLNAGMEILGVFGPFILLGIAIMFAPRLFGLAKQAIAARNSGRA